MTRINVIPPHRLLDEHLRAEYRELPRVSNLARALPKGSAPSRYVLGAGPCKFFYDKTGYLSRRKGEIIVEAQRRGFAIQFTQAPRPIPGLDNDWIPDAAAVQTNVAHRKERFWARPHLYRFWGAAAPLDFYDLAFGALEAT